MKQLGQIQQQILCILEQHPEGIDIAGIRDEGNISGHQHLDRRLRDLYPDYVIERIKHGRKTLYKLIGPRPPGEWEYETISKKLRAKILHRDGYRCQMCGRTVKEDHIKLHVDHKLPQDWGGDTSEENLWSLCSACNEGKKDYFKSFDNELMKEVMHYESVHDRIAYLLKSKQDQWVDADIIEFVANYQDHQTDWRKRLRELRYFDLNIEVTRIKHEKRTISRYKLTNWENLPPDTSKAAREYERQRAERNKKKT